MKNLERFALLLQEGRSRGLNEDEKEFMRLWTERNRLAKAYARLTKENARLKERIEMAIDYLPESPQKAMGFLKASK